MLIVALQAQDLVKKHHTFWAGGSTRLIKSKNGISFYLKYCFWLAGMITKNYLPHLV